MYCFRLMFITVDCGNMDEMFCTTGKTKENQENEYQENMNWTEVLMMKFRSLKSVPLSHEKKIVRECMSVLARFVDARQGSCTMDLQGLEDVTVYFDEEDRAVILECVEMLKKHVAIQVRLEGPPPTRPAPMAEKEIDETATNMARENISDCETNRVESNEPDAGPVEDMMNVTNEIKTETREKLPYPFKGFDARRKDKALEMFLKKFKKTNRSDPANLTRIPCDDMIAAIDRWLEENKKCVSKLKKGSVQLELCKDNEIQEYFSLVGGSWSVPLERHQDFLAVFSKAIVHGKILCYNEMKTGLSVWPLTIDLDMKVREKDRVYNMEHVKFLIQHIRDLLVVRLPNAKASCYVLEKGTEARGPKSKHGETFFKDGIHLVFPTLFVNEGAALKLRHDLLGRMTTIFAGCEFLNSWDDIFDENVMKNGGSWLLYGCRKPEDTHSWTCTTVVSPEGETAAPMETFEALVKLLSIRKVPGDGDILWKEEFTLRKRNHSEMSGCVTTPISGNALDTSRLLNEILSDYARSQGLQTDFKGLFDIKRKGFFIEVCPTDKCNCLVDMSHVHGSGNNSLLVVTNKNVLQKCRGSHQDQNKTMDKPFAVRIQKLLIPDFKDDSSTCSEFREDKNVEIFNLVKDFIHQKAKLENLKRLDNIVYKQGKINVMNSSGDFVEVDNPCYYEPKMTCEKWLAEISKEHRMQEYIFDKGLKYFRIDCNYDEFPMIETDMHMISWADGITILAEEIKFVPWPATEFQNRCARVHIPVNFLGSQDNCPLFDQFLTCQKYSVDETKFVYMAFGRLLFPVHKYDRWDFIPFLQGESGCGKSTMMEAFLSFFHEERIGTIDRQTQLLFGLDDLYRMDLIIAPDLPKDMDEVLPATTFQLMVEGNKIKITRKNKAAINTRWTVPMLWAGNFPPDYKNANGLAIARRLLTIPFPHVVPFSQQNPRILEKIKATELPAILKRCVRTYFEMVRLNDEKSVWDFCPDVFKKNQESLIKEYNHVLAFLTGGLSKNRGTNACYEFIMGDDNTLTRLSDFEDAYVDCFKKKIPCRDAEIKSTLERFGCVLAHVHMCQSCWKVAKGPKQPGGPCCSSYDNAKRSKVPVIKRLQMVKQPKSCTFE